METFSIDGRKLSIQVGHWLLVQSDNETIELDAFMDWWKTILPDNIQEINISDLFHFSYLKEETKMNKTVKFISYIDPRSLPTEALQLFEFLFNLKRKVNFQIFLE